MRPRIEGSIGDEAMEDCFLKFTDDEMKASFLQTLHTMRKHRLFCDVVLNVGNADIHAHKNVLACVSPHFMELFSAEQNLKNGHGEDIPSFRLNGGITKEALQILVDYAYTAKLEIPDILVKDVYMAAWKLKMERVVKECARHLIAELSSDTCIEIRSLPGINKNISFVNEVDAFINNEFTAVSETAEFLQLSCVQIDVLYQTKQEMSLVTHGSLCRLVLDWIKRQLSDETLSEKQLLERTHLLYLALDNSLQDCSDLPPGHESESELVQDYKRMVLKCPNNKQRRKCLAVPGRPRVLIYSRDIGDDENEKEVDWNLISSTKCGENAFVGLATINGYLMRMSVKMRLNNATISSNISPLNSCSSNTTESLSQLNQLNSGNLNGISMSGGSVNGGGSSGSGNGGNGVNGTNGVHAMNGGLKKSTNNSAKTSADSTMENSTNDLELFCEVAAMSGPKCGLGVAEINGKLLVCGGYDRGECLKKVESYCPDTNTWTRESNMNEARGRVQVAVIDGAVYAVGGSNGQTELDTVECLKPESEKWQKCKRLPLARSNAGTCALHNKLYCIGGWNGQIGIKQCDVYEPENDQWSQIASLNTGRYQAGVTSFHGKLWAVGGSDAWNCLNSVETYDPEQNVWLFSPSLLTPRRGCGIAEFQNKLYVVGGSDGTQSLSSTEIYDEETKTWILGPSLITPRSNVSVVMIRDKLYAIGGFSGKTFLNTMEFLDGTTNEWTSFVPHQKDAERITQVLLAQSSLSDANDNAANQEARMGEVQKIIESIKQSSKNLNDLTNAITKETTKIVESNVTDTKHQKQQQQQSNGIHKNECNDSSSDSMKNNGHDNDVVKDGEQIDSSSNGIHENVS